MSKERLMKAAETNEAADMKTELPLAMDRSADADALIKASFGLVEAMQAARFELIDALMDATERCWGSSIGALYMAALSTVRRWRSSTSSELYAVQIRWSDEYREAKLARAEYDAVIETALNTALKVPATAASPMEWATLIEETRQKAEMATSDESTYENAVWIAARAECDAAIETALDAAAWKAGRVAAERLKRLNGGSALFKAALPDAGLMTTLNAALNAAAWVAAERRLNAESAAWEAAGAEHDAAIEAAAVKIKALLNTALNVAKKEERAAEAAWDAAVERKLAAKEAWDAAEAEYKAAMNAAEAEYKAAMGAAEAEYKVAMDAALTPKDRMMAMNAATEARDAAGAEHRAAVYSAAGEYKVAMDVAVPEYRAADKWTSSTLAEHDETGHVLDAAESASKVWAEYEAVLWAEREAEDDSWMGDE